MAGNDSTLAWAALGFAETPTAALRLRTDIIVSHHRIRPLVGINPAHPTMADWQDDEALLNRAPAYWWATDVAAAVSAASASYPLDTDIGRFLYMPTMHSAFCCFEAPVLSVEIEGARIDLVALAWTVGSRIKEPDAIRLIIRGYARSGSNRAVITPVFFVDDDRQPLADKTLEAERDACSRWILTASMFIEQRLAIAAPASHIERHARKEAARRDIEPTIRVINLRRANRVDEQAESQSDRAWSCQWLVSGHWRNQWYGKAQRHVPRWIAPYVKGPDDKPMRAPKAEVFAVRR